MDKQPKDNTTDGLTLAEAMHLHALEGNSFDAEDVALFEMFDREGWPQERRLAHIVELARLRSVVPAAE